MTPQTYMQPSETSDLSRLSPHHSPTLQLPLHESSTSPPLSNDRRGSYAGTSDTDITPPTSSSGFSSQERPVLVNDGYEIPSFPGYSTNSLRPLASNLAGPNLKIAATSLSQVAPSKRTSTGEIKRSNKSSADGRENNRKSIPGHSRTPSLLSNGSSISEVCFSQLN